MKGGYAVIRPVERDKPLIIAEGIETAASAAQIADLPAIAALSAPNMKAVYPPDCAEIIIAADDDEAGREASKELGVRLASGRRTSIALPPRGVKDWNDALRACKGEEDIAKLKEILLTGDLVREQLVSKARGAGLTLWRHHHVIQIDIGAAGHTSGALCNDDACAARVGAARAVLAAVSAGYEYARVPARLVFRRA